MFHIMSLTILYTTLKYLPLNKEIYQTIANLYTIITT